METRYNSAVAHRTLVRCACGLALLCSFGFDWPGRAERLLAARSQPSTQAGRRDLLRLIGGLQSPAAKAALQEAAQDPDAEVRAEALRALARIGGSDVVPVEIAALTDGVAGVRAAAADALGVLRDKSSVTALARSLSDSEVSVRTASARALGAVGDRAALSALSAALDDASTDVRVAATKALAQIGDPAAIQIITGKARDPAPELRVAVLYALTELRDPALASVVLPALDDSNEQVVLAALRAITATRLSGVEPSLAELTHAANPRIAGAARAALSRVASEANVAEGDDRTAARKEEPAWLSLLERTAAPDIADPEGLLLALEEALPAHEPLAADPLLEWLPRAPKPLRARIARLIAPTASASGVKRLLPLLDDPDPAVRAVVATTIGASENPSVAPPLLAHLADPDEPARDAAARALGKVLDLSTVLSVARMLESKDEGQERSAALVLSESLARLQSSLTPDVRSTVKAALLRAWGSTDEVLSARAARGLAWLHDPEVIAALAKKGATLRPAHRVASARASVLDKGSAARALRKLRAADRDAAVASAGLTAQVLAGDAVPEDVLFAQLDHAAWPLGPVAAFAIARATTRSDSPVRIARLCSALGTQEPMTRANLVAALARAPQATCLDAQGLDWLARARAWPVRFAAACWAKARAQLTGDARFQQALVRCAQRDPSEPVRAACDGRPFRNGETGPADAFRALIMEDGTVLVSPIDGARDPSWPGVAPMAVDDAWQGPYGRE